MEIYDVVVVGAGPIGLATAIGLRQRGIENILVIDQTRGFRQVGQVLDILPNGLKALKYLALPAYEEVKKNGIGFSNPQQSKDGENIGITQEQKSPKIAPAWVTKNLQGQVIRSTLLGYDHWCENYGEGRVSTSWYNLQTTLRNLLPQHQVKANHRCINVVDEPENGCVRIDCVSDTNIEANPYAYWADGQKSEETQQPNSDVSSQQLETKSLRAKLIVAADGINSTVRWLLYTDSPNHDFAQPEYSGFAAISCREITEIPKELQTHIEEKFFHESVVVTISNDEVDGNYNYVENPRMILFHRPSGQIGYMIHLALPLESLQGKSGSSLIDLAVEELEKAGFPDALQQLVGLSTPANIQQRPYYIHHATLANYPQIPPPWSAGRVVLVGDAAHGMPPFMAQGVNQGFEDALAVATLIANIAEENNWDNKQAIATAFEKYEHLRRPLMAYIQEATLTRFPNSSGKELQKYNQRVYVRDFENYI